MSFLFAVDDESVARGAALRPVAAGVLLAAGAVGSGLTAWATATSPILVTPEADAIVRAFVVGLYMIAGVYVWVRRPNERFGQVLVLISLAYALTTFNTFPETPRCTRSAGSTRPSGSCSCSPRSSRSPRDA